MKLLICCHYRMIIIRAMIDDYGHLVFLFEERRLREVENMVLRRMTTAKIQRSSGVDRMIILKYLK